ncbi:MAG: DUF362 domain-containing protein [Selenomonadaceae bacterium]|nr:DUF362 domain-containing protein [Selenomonadaceae bacterium]
MNKAVISHADNYRIESVKEALNSAFQKFFNLTDREKNPLGVGGLIKPGDSVFIKPNWVASRWRASCPHEDSLYCVITHPSVIEAVVDYVAVALEGRGEIILGDNPSIDADFEELMNTTKIRRLEKKYDGLLKIKDLRPLVCDDLKNYGKKNLMVHQLGDDRGAVEVNLGKDSLLYGINPERFRGVFDEREETVMSHTGDKQLYTFSKSLYDADVYISVPKLKTHQKVGVTLNLKGLVGSVTNKNQLVHWQVGYPEIQGDEYPDKVSYDKSKTAKVTHRGAWYGNDTIWRMVVDLYLGMKRKERKYFSIVDGIMGGEGQGPFCPTAKHSNSLIIGDDLLAVDCVATRYMGINPLKVKYLKYFLERKFDSVTLEDLKVCENNNDIKNFFESESMYTDFMVSDLWKELKTF